MIDEVAGHHEGDERRHSPAGVPVGAVGGEEARSRASVPTGTVRGRAGHAVALRGSGADDEQSSATDDSDDVLTVDQAARLLRVGRNQLYEAIGRGEIPHRRIGRSIRLSRLALTHWLQGA